MYVIKVHRRVWSDRYEFIMSDGKEVTEKVDLTVSNVLFPELSFEYLASYALYFSLSFLCALNFA